MTAWSAESLPERWKETAIAGVALAAVAACCFWMLFWHPAGLLVGPQRDGHNDLTAFFWPGHSVPRLSLAWHGQYPVWNPHAGTGAPWYGHSHSACWYPPNWFLLLWDTGTGLCWLMVAHQWWAGLGVFLVCRRWGFGVLSSLLGGSLMLAAPYHVAEMGEGHYASLCALSWAPWAMLAYEGFRGQPSRGWPWVTLVLAVSVLTGGFQEACYLGVTLTVLAAVDAGQQWRRGCREAGAQVLTHWFAAGAMTAAVVAAAVFPVWTRVQQSLIGSGAGTEGAGQAGLELAHFWQLLHSAALGGPEAYQGPGFYSGSLCYFGLVTLCLAGFGVLTQWRRYPVVRCLGLWLAALGFSFGAENAFYGLFAPLVPGLTSFSEPNRALFLCAFAVTVLAAAGAESVADAVRGVAPWGGRRTQRGLVAAGAACAVLMLAAWGWGKFSQQPAAAAETAAAAASGEAGPDSGPGADGWFWERWHATGGRWQTWAWLAAACGLLGLATAGSRAARWSLAGLAGLGLFELAGHADRVLCIAPRAEVRQRSPVTDFLRGRADGPRVIAEQSLLSDREAVEHGIFKLQGSDPVPLLRYSFAMHALNGLREPAPLILGFGRLDLQGLNHSVADLLGVRYAVVSPQTGEPPPGWKRVKRGRLAAEWTLRGRAAAELPYEIYENPTALPRCFAVGGVRILGPTDLASQVLATIDPRREVLLGQDVLGDVPRTEFRPARLVRFTPGEVVVDVTLAQPGYLVLSDTWYPGWTATDNGRRAAVLPANVAGRAVPLGPGRHRVVFRYGWRRYFGGIVISALALAIVALQIRRRMRSTAAQVPSPDLATPSVGQAPVDH